jgi:hypothetical protein
MRIVNLKGIEVELYDSPEDAPIDRYQKFNRFLLIEAEIGSDLAAFDKRCQAIKAFAKTSPDKAIQEIENMRQTVRLSLSGVSPTAMSFAALTKRVGRHSWGNVLSDTDIQEIQGALSKSTLTHRLMKATVDAVKKKWIPRLKRFFRN